ncbi:MAG TPA: hypothetical protein VE287_04605 [Actinopolymorphaceae bacterium]|nr:hypothetical protein [Actinopolymorphaceae bacterium]
MPASRPDTADSGDLVVDAAAAAPELSALRTAVAQRDWPEVSGFLSRLSDPDDREYAVRIVAMVNDSDDFLRDMAAAEGAASTVASTLYAARLVQAGWSIRTSYRAKHVSREQFAGFHDHLRRAERILIDVTAKDPANSSAWAQRLVTARGLELGQAEVRRRFDQVRRHVPHLYAAEVEFLQQLCPKWSGNLEKMWEFARECLTTSTPGSLSPLTIVEGHLEQWSETESNRTPSSYFTRPDVRDEINEAAERSVRHPDFRPGYRWIVAHNLFALAFSLMQDHQAAAPHFRRLGNLIATPYWSYFGDERALFRQHRAAALRHG